MTPTDQADVIGHALVRARTVREQFRFLSPRAKEQATGELHAIWTAVGLELYHLVQEGSPEDLLAIRRAFDAHGERPDGPVVRR